MCVCVCVREREREKEDEIIAVSCLMSDGVGRRAELRRRVCFSCRWNQ